MGSDVTGFHNQLSLKVIKGPLSFIITALSLKKSILLLFKLGASS